MKTHFLLFCIVLLCPGFGFSQNYSAARQRTLEILQKYDPDSYAMITSYEKTPTSFRVEGMGIDLGKHTDFMEYIDGYAESDILQGLGTAVHEMSHSYTFRMHYAYRYERAQLKDFSTTYSLIYQKPSQQTLIRHTSTFPSREMKNAIAADFRTSRFSTYISEAPDLQSTQQSGIYGLLDEWNAYYLDTRIAFLLYPYYQNESQKRPEDWLNFMSGVDGVLYAHMEFKYYILNYLIFAKQNHPTIYQEIIQNEAFKTAYRHIDRDFTQLIQEYFQVREQLLADLKAQGHRVSFTEEFTFIGSNGRGNFMHVYTLLQKELEKPKYKAMQNILRS